MSIAILIWVTIYNVHNLSIWGWCCHFRLEILVKVFYLGRWDEVSSDAPLDKLLCLESMSSETEIESLSNVVLDSWEEVRATDVCEEADTSLWHGVDCVICCHSDWSMDWHTDATSHDDSVPDADLKRLHLGKRVVKNVFIMEKLSFDFGVSFSSSRLIDVLDISSCTKSFATNSTQEQHSWSSLRIIVPKLDFLQHQMNHLQIKRI